MKISHIFWILGITLISMACNSQASTNTDEELETFQVFTPLVKDTSYFNYYVADIAAINNVEIRSRVKGYLEKIHIDEGQRVAKGQLLFSISNQEYREELLKAKANYASAVAELKAKELEMNNAEMLFEKDVISQTEVEMAKARLEAARSQVAVTRSQEASANLNLAFTEIRAPFSGVVNRIQYKIGSLIDESTLMTTLSDDAEVFAYFNVSEREYLNFIRRKVKNEEEVSLILANGEEHKTKGNIETIEGEFDNVTGSISFRARFQNPGNILRHGATGKIKLVRSLENVMIIPQKSTFELQDKLFVYVVTKDNEVEMRQITTGIRLPQLFTVTEGLDTSDRVVFEGVQLLRAGQKINAQKFSLDDFFASQQPKL